MNNTFWLVGRLVDNTWEFQGLYVDEIEAIARCETDYWFIAPVVLGEFVPPETTEDWPGSYFSLYTGDQ